MRSVKRFAMNPAYDMRPGLAATIAKSGTVSGEPKDAFFP
jgi:hypothetical protein